MHVSNQGSFFVVCAAWASNQARVPNPACLHSSVMTSGSPAKTNQMRQGWPDHVKHRRSNFTCTRENVRSRTARAESKAGVDMYVPGVSTVTVLPDVTGVDCSEASEGGKSGKSRTRMLFTIIPKSVSFVEKARRAADPLAFPTPPWNVSTAKEALSLTALGSDLSIYVKP